MCRDDNAMNDLIRLAPQDNTLVVSRLLDAGTALHIDNRRVVLAVNLPIGHKIAATDIKAGDEILKYGAPIGIATADISMGEHVHVHNVRSNYTPSYVVTAEDQGDD